MELTRRAFLGLTSLIATTAGAVEDLIRYRLLGFPAPPDDEPLLPREPDRWLPAVCQLCSAGCGIAARVAQGRVVKLEGLPAHPVNRGALCPRGLAGLTELYHPDRLLRPMKRIGRRGEGRFEPIAWEQAIARLVEPLRALRRRGEPHRVAWLDGPSSGLSRQLIQRFLRTFGSPHDLELSPPSGQLPVDAFRWMVDQEGEPLYDLAQANFILSFGLDWLQTYPSPVEASRAYGLLRRGRADRRVRIVQVEPRFSVTAAKSDEWIPILPGQEGLLALGIAHVLIRERLFHEPFVQDNASGLEEFARAVESHAAPEVVAQRTGVSVETIYRLAREFGLRKGLAVGTRADLLTQWAVMSLNGLVGNLDARGGILRRWEPEGLSLPAEAEPDQVAGHGLRAPALTSAEALPDVLLAQRSSPLDLVLISHANPCFLSPSSSRWVEALEQLPFMVSFASFLDETALQADLIVPLATALEQWQFVPAMASDGSVAVNISQPVVRPRGEARPMEEVIMQLAHALGPPVDQAFPWESMEGFVRERAQVLYESTQGTLLPQIIIPGRARPEEEEPPTDFEEFWEQLLARGGVVWPAERAPWPEFRTPSGQFELFPQQINDTLQSSPSLFVHPLTPQGGGIHEEDSSHAEYPLQLYLYAPLAFLNGYGAHLPFLQQIAGSQLHEAWETWAELHPETAKQVGVRDGEPIRIASAHGTLHAKARVVEGVAPAVIAMPLGLGHTAPVHWAQGIGANPAQLVGRTLDRVTHQPLWQDTWVRIWKV